MRRLAYCDCFELLEVLLLAAAGAGALAGAESPPGFVALEDFVSLAWLLLLSDLVSVLLSDAETLSTLPSALASAPVAAASFLPDFA